MVILWHGIVWVCYRLYSNIICFKAELTYLMDCFPIFSFEFRLSSTVYSEFIGVSFTIQFKPINWRIVWNNYIWVLSIILHDLSTLQRQKVMVISYFFTFPGAFPSNFNQRQSIAFLFNLFILFILDTFWYLSVKTIQEEYIFIFFSQGIFFWHFLRRGLHSADILSWSYVLYFLLYISGDERPADSNSDRKPVILSHTSPKLVYPVKTV